MTLEIKNNHFFTKYVPPITVPVVEDFPDLPLSGGQTFELESYDTNTKVLLSSSTSPEVTYGDYELVGGYLRTYMSDMSLGSQTSAPPNYGIYKLKDEWPVTKGGFTIATGSGGERVGHKMRLMQSVSYAGTNTLYSENFDGEDKSLTFSGNPLVADVKFKHTSYKMTLESLANIKGWSIVENEYSVQLHTIAVPEQHVGIHAYIEAGYQQYVEYMREAYGSTTSATSRASANVDAYKWSPLGLAVTVVPKNGNSWKVKQDESVIITNQDIIDNAYHISNADYNYFVGAEADIMKGVKTFARALNDESTSIEAETNNTILSDFKSTINFENPWSANTVAPLLQTNIQLTDGQGKDGSKALELYHMWDMADEYKSVTGTSTTETMLGVSGNINPQTAMAGVFNLPVPAVIDNGRDITDGAGSGSTKYVVIPEVSMDVKISKLEPAPLYGVKSNKTVYGTNGNQVTMAYGWKPADLDGTDSTDVTNFSGSELDNGMRIMDATDGDYMQSTLRSFTICFSNYKPLETHNTLDEFIAYGLANFYGSGAAKRRNGTGAGQDISRGIVGGVTFRRQVSDDDDSTTTLVAEALPVTRNYDAFAPRGESNSVYAYKNGWKPVCDGATTDVATSMIVEAIQKPIPSGTVIDFPSSRTFTVTTPASQGDTNLLGTRGGTGTIPSGTEASNNLGDDDTVAGDTTFYGMAILNGGTVNTPKNKLTWDTLTYSRNFNSNKKVEIPTNSYFNLRFFMDVSQATSVFSQTKMPYIRFPGGSSGEGVFIRCIIDTGDTADDASNDTGSEDMLFIDIPFPVGLCSGAADSLSEPGRADSGNDVAPWSVANNPGRYPRYMTMWLHNYRWCSGSSDSDWFQYGDNNALMNVSGGCATEAQVFIDNITLNNFTPEVTDATSTKRARGIIDMKPGTTKTPLTVLTGSSGGGSAGDIKMNAFSNGGSVYTYVSSTTSVSGVGPDETKANLYDVAPGTYILMGFENKTDLPQSQLTTAVGTFTPTSSTDVLRSGGPFNDISPDATSGAGDIANTKFNVVINSDPFAGTAHFTLISGGSGYAVDDTLTFNGSSIGGGADVVLTITAFATGGRYGYWMTNNFWSNNFSALSGSAYSVDLTDSGFLRNKAILNMGYSNTGGTGMSKNKYFGLNMYSQLLTASGTPSFADNVKGSEFDIVSADAAIDPTNADAQMKMIFPTGTNDIYSADGFTQKGFSYLSVSGTSTTAPSYDSWGKREHILASTKIVGVVGVSSADPWGANAIENDRTVRVADPDIFATHNDDSFIIYRIYGDGTADTHVKGISSPLKLESPNSIVSNLVTFDKSVTLADDDSTSLCVEDNLSELYVCPYKYWVILALDSGAEKVPRSTGQWVFVNETPSTGSIGTQTGSTFNESPYFYDTGASFVAGNQGKSALYQNEWSLSPSNPTSAIQTQVDFGYGTVEHKDGTATIYSPTDGAALGIVDSQTLKRDSYLDYSLFGLMNAGTIPLDVPNQEFAIMLTPLDPTNTKKGTFYTTDSTDTAKTPRLYWNYYDAVPQKPLLTLSPAVQMIPSGDAPAKEKIDLYNITSENLNALKFEWQEADSDIWYRYILLGESEGVYNKYKGAKWYAPLNEAPAEQNLSTAPTYKIYDEVADTSGSMTNGGAVLSDVNGLSGWTAVFDGSSTSYLQVPYATNSYPSGSAGEWSLVTHCIPASDAGTGDDLQWIVYRANSALDEIGYRVGITGCTTAAPKVIVAAAEITMTGTSAIPFDGVTPLNIIATFKSGSSIGPDANLYVNGVKEDYQNTATTYTDSTSDTYIGSTGSSANRFMGSIEELILYDHEIVVPTHANEWIHSTANTLDVDSGGDIINHSAKLFLFDYHNIRGKNPSLVCQSNTVGWRTTI